MKIVTKEITSDGKQLLVYKMTETNRPVNGAIVTSEALEAYVDSINDDSITLPRENLNYLEYIKQDG